MELDQIELTLLPAPDDPERVCYEVQARLLEIHEALRGRGVSVIPVGVSPEGDSHIGQFIFTLDAGAIPAIAAVSDAWVRTRHGRRVRLTIDDTATEIRTADAIDAWLQRLAVAGGGLQTPSPVSAK